MQAAMKKGILPVMTVLCVIAVIGMVIALTAGGRQESFSPPPFDPAAQSGTPDVSEGSGYGEMDAKAFRFSACGELSVQDGKTDVWLTNPAENEVWMKVRVMDEGGNTLGESGLIRPGEYVQSVKLDTVPDQTIPVSLKVMAYEPDTYYSAGAVTLNTNLNSGGGGPTS